MDGRQALIGLGLGVVGMATVLIVEDEPTVLMLANSILRHAGYETITAGTLAQAQAVIGSDQKIDLVFTDIQLIDDLEAGIMIGQMARQLRADIPVVYASARAFTDGLQAQFVERSTFLPKPYTDKQVVDAVAKALEGAKRPPERPL